MGEFKDVVIVSGCRTAVGSYGGSLKGVLVEVFGKLSRWNHIMQRAEIISPVY